MRRIKTRQPELHDSTNKNESRARLVRHHSYHSCLHNPHPPQGPRFTAGLLRDLLCQAQGVFVASAMNCCAPHAARRDIAYFGEERERLNQIWREVFDDQGVPEGLSEEFKRRHEEFDASCAGCR